MSDKSPNDFNRICWELAKDYFKAMDRTHISRMIEHSANKRILKKNKMSQETEIIKKREQAAFELYVNTAKMIVDNKKKPKKPDELAKIWDELRRPFDLAFKGYDQ